MKKLLLVLLFLFGANAVPAQDHTIDAEHRDLALQLLQALKIEQQMSQQFDTIKRYQENMYKDIEMEESLKKAGLDGMTDYKDDMWSFMIDLMSWDNIKEDYVVAYARVYSKDELRIFIEFFSSPMGEIYVDKTPQLSAEIMAISQKRAQPMITESMKKARISANDALAQSTLRTLSTASETYATANNGLYPTTSRLLVEAVPPYLNQDYCDRTEAGFHYDCEMKSNSYRFTATPEIAGESGSRIFEIITGGILKKY